VTVSDTAPENPGNGTIWRDTTAGKVWEWSTASVQWAEIPTVYTKVVFNTRGFIPRRFTAHDGVSIEGCISEAVNGSKILTALGGDEDTDDYIVVVGLLEDGITEQTSGNIRLQRRVPEMDYICEAKNRLWGCRYGKSEDGESINELYCCALGDFKNWEQYQGLSTDAWRASVGSDGPWTGAVNYLGYPMFFKENRIHRVSVSSVGAHQVTETVCRGVQEGCSRSLQVVNETLFYKSRADVCAYQGSFPESVSEALGDASYSNAAAGSGCEKA
jgi:hypothetical protein